MPLPPAAEKLLSDVDKKLHEENQVNRVLEQIETKTGVKRLHIVIGFIGLHALYLIFGRFAELLCNIIGFVYPAYISSVMKAIESSSKDDDTQWLTYWVVFALFSILEFFSDIFLKYFPIYWLVKCGFLLYLYSPMTLGAQKIYHRFLQPFIRKHHMSIDKHIGEAADKIGEKLNG
ncbi:unnamed protein product [Dracunculus medinensis]|uniref:Receptor expression-enhancing protein n=1 Tax=Dracunculus medinensis TaxID=318479 RepID=A0A0N4U953_DRAME|nr:unnamed protein product [Dracunculus medinensis]